MDEVFDPFTHYHPGDGEVVSNDEDDEEELKSFDEHWKIQDVLISCNVLVFIPCLLWILVYVLLDS